MKINSISENSNISITQNVSQVYILKQIQQYQQFQQSL